jgi:hypothetical protein
MSRSYASSPICHLHGGSGTALLFFILLYSFPESCLLTLQNNTMLFSVHVFSFQNDSKKDKKVTYNECPKQDLCNA